MVVRNTIQKSDCHIVAVPRPRRLSFDIGAYSVSTRWAHDGKLCHVGIWHERSKIGYIQMYRRYHDLRTVFSVDTHIDQNYQGCGIAYRAYEGLVSLGNMAIQSGCQSRGAIKLWRRFITNPSIAIYFVVDSVKLCDGDIFVVTADHSGKLAGVDYTGKLFDPYKQFGSLMLVHRHHALDRMLCRHIAWRQQTNQLMQRYRRYDHVKL